jgi:hypothetical protein
MPNTTSAATTATPISDPITPPAIAPVLELLPPPLDLVLEVSARQGELSRACVMQHQQSICVTL